MKQIDSSTFVQTSEDLKLRMFDSWDGLECSQTISTGNNFATNCDIKDFNLITGHWGFSNEGGVKLWDLRKLESTVFEFQTEFSVVAT